MGAWWHKADWSWQREWVYLPEIIRLRLNWLVGVAWQEGGLPDDKKKITKLAGLTMSDLNDLWAEFTETFELRGNHWLLPSQWQAINDQKAQADRGRVAGQASAAARKAKNQTKQPSKPSKQTNDFRQQDVDGGSTHTRARDTDAETGQTAKALTGNWPAMKTDDLGQRHVNGRSTESNGSQQDKRERENKNKQVSSSHREGEGIPPGRDRDQDQAQDRAMIAALCDMFPAEPPEGTKLARLILLARKYHATAEDIRRWPDWMRARWRGKPHTVFTFGDFFHQMMEEGRGAAAWLNGSVGARFTLYVLRHQPDQPLSPEVRDAVIATGAWLDRQAGNLTRDDWIRRGWTPENFSQFWAERYENRPRPKADTLQAMWGEFVEWVGEPDDKQGE